MILDKIFSNDILIRNKNLMENLKNILIKTKTTESATAKIKILDLIQNDSKNPKNKFLLQSVADIDEKNLDFAVQLYNDPDIQPEMLPNIIKETIIQEWGDVNNGEVDIKRVERYRRAFSDPKNAANIYPLLERGMSLHDALIVIKSKQSVNLSNNSARESSPVSVAQNKNFVGQSADVYNMLINKGLNDKEASAIIKAISTKDGIVNPEMIPEYVILDSVCIEKLPPSIIASTGVDALAHAVECYTSNKHNAVSDTFALAGASLIFHNICTAYDDPSNMVAKSSMLLGAFYGGLAITSSGTTAVHALSYPLGGKFHVPHGISNAVLFAPVMRFNKLFCLPRLASLCDYVYPQNYGLSDVEKAEIIIGRIEYIISHVNIPDGMEKLGVKETDIDFLVKEASQQTRLLSNNCVNLTFDDIRKIYQESMGALNGN